MATGVQATQSNEYKILSEMVGVKDPILFSTLPSLDSPFESETVLGNQIQCDIESMDTSPPHNHEAHTGPGSNIPVISQSQPGHEPDSDEDKPAHDLSPPTTSDEEIDYNSVVNHYNAVVDKTDDYLSTELKSILDHRYINGVLELKLEYTTGKVSWYSLDLAKRENPYVTTSYIISNRGCVPFFFEKSEACLLYSFLSITIAPLKLKLYLGA